MLRRSSALALLALASAACEREPLPAAERTPVAPAGRLEIGTGRHTVIVEPCLARLDPSTQVLQLQGRDGTTLRFYAELSAASLPDRLNHPIQAATVVYQAEAPLSPDEDTLYTHRGLSFVVEALGEGQAQGRFEGLLEDLSHGRTHEVRGTFRCALDTP